MRRFWRTPVPHPVTAVSTPLPPPPAIPVSIFLDAIADHLLHWIAQQDIIVGCVAWLTREDVAEALAKRPLCSIIMRHETEKAMAHTSVVASRNVVLQHCFMAQIPGAPPAFAARYWLHPMVPVAPWRTRRSSPTTLLIHHTFLVGCHLQTHDTDTPLLPVSTWYGSSHMTVGAEHQRDSALILDDPRLSHPFFDEWRRLLPESIPFAESTVSQASYAAVPQHIREPILKRKDMM